MFTTCTREPLKSCHIQELPYFLQAKFPSLSEIFKNLRKRFAEFCLTVTF